MENDGWGRGEAAGDGRTNTDILLFIYFYWVALWRRLRATSIVSDWLTERETEPMVTGRQFNIIGQTSCVNHKVRYIICKWGSGEAEGNDIRVAVLMDVTTSTR